MTKRQALIVALGMSVLIYRGTDLWRMARNDCGTTDLGVSLDLVAGELQVTAVHHAHLDGRPTAAWRAHVRPGDSLVAFDDGTGRRVAVTSLAVLGRALRALSASPRAALILERGSPAGPQELRLARPSSDGAGLVSLALRAFLIFILPLLAVVTALLIIVLRPADGQAFLASILFLSFSALFGTEFWLFPPGLREFASVVHQCLAYFFGYLLLRFFLVFPGRGAIDRAVPWLKHVLLAVTAVTAAAMVTVTLTATYSLHAAGVAFARLGGVTSARLAGIAVVGMILLGLLSGVWETAHAATPGDRRRLGILLAGALAGLLPLLFVMAYVWLTGRNSVEPWMALLVLPTLPLFPISFMYAVVRHRVLGVPLIVRKGLQYALVSRGFLGAEGLVVFVALYFGVGPEIASRFPAAGGGAIATTNAVVTLFVVVGLAGVNRRLKPVLDRRFFRDPYNAQHVLAELAHDFARAPTDPRRLAEALATRLSASLHARVVAVFLDEQLARTRTDAPGSTGGAGCRFVRRACVPVPAAPATGGAAGDPLPLELPVSVESLDGGPDGLFASSVVVQLEPGSAWVTTQVAGKEGRQTRPVSSSDLAGLWRLGIRLLVPLSGRDRFFGWLVLGDKLSEEAYTLEDRVFVQTAAQQAATALDYSRLIGRVAEQEAMRREMDIARQVQAGLFPQRHPPVATLDYHGACRTAREVGGDYFDFLGIASSQLGIAVGDISGKGVSAALLMSNLQAMFRSRAPSEGLALDRLVADVNRLLAEATDPSKFATLFYGVYDGATRRLTYVNAGHNPPMLVRAGAHRLDRLNPTGMALGFTADACYEMVEVRLEPGDLLVVFTDGVTEAFDEDGNEFGEAGLAAAVVEHRGQDASTLCESVLADLSRFVGSSPQNDDITLVVARVV